MLATKNISSPEKYKNDFMLKIHPTVPIPTEQELYKIVSPEQVCLFESMRAGQQRLIDSGFGATGGMDSDDDDDDEMRVDAEVALAPWNITKNVLLACHNKGMCRVYGPGDPTGRGEGFSFFRFSMKKMFLRSGASQEEIAAAKEARTKTGHKFAISEQQKVYKEEILRIWLAQLQSLSNEEEPGLSDDDYQAMEHDEEAEQYAQEQEDEEDYDIAEGSPAGTLTIIDHGVGGAAAKTLSHAIDVSSADGGSRASSPALFPSRLLHQRPDMGDDQMTAETQSVSSSRYAGRSRGGLLISRTVRNEDGEEEQREEVITDPRVINAYRKQKRLLQLSDAFNAEDDEETRKRKLIEELRRRKRMQGKRSKEERAAASTTKRKCKACGATGHIASNKVCPKYYQTFPERLKKEKEKAASAKAAAAAAAAASTPAPVKAQNGKITISSSAIASSKKSLTVKLPSIKLISGTASGTSSKHASPEK